MRHFILLGLLSFASMNAMAKCTEAFANTTMGRVTLSCLKITGAAHLKGTTIQDTFDVLGELTASESHFNQLNAIGKTTLTRVSIAGDANIVGSLQASDTSFGGELKLAAVSATFTHANLNNLKVTSTKPATIELNESTVNGDITFVKGNGVVKNNRSTIKGKIIGGKITE